MPAKRKARSSKRSTTGEGGDLKSRDFLDWITTRGYCETCGRAGVTHDNGERLLHPSHVKSRGSGGHDIGNVVPQCAECHHKLHQMGTKVFEARYKVRLSMRAKKYADQWYGMH